MADLDWYRVTTEGVTLVGVLVRTDVPERVTIEPTHDGPIRAPRRQGVPEAGWVGGHWQGVVEPDDIHAIGYATPSQTGDTPVVIADTEPASGDKQEVTPEAVVRALGDHAPARDAVPPPEMDTPDGSGTRPAPHEERRLDRVSAVDAPTHPR